jgi:hypothetical protein
MYTTHKPTKVSGMVWKKTSYSRNNPLSKPFRQLLWVVYYFKVLCYSKEIVEN